MTKLKQTTVSKQFAVTGLLGASSFVFQTQAYAANYGTLTDSTITLGHGDVVTADTLFGEALYGVYYFNGTAASIDLGGVTKIIADGNDAAAGGIYL